MSLCCCKKCSYKDRDGYCSLLKADVKKIQCTPCKISSNLLEEGEKYMMENHRKIFLHYIKEQTDISLQIGDLLTVLDATFFWHFDNSHPKYLRIVKELEDGSYECIDPFFNAAFEAFSMHYVEMGYNTLLTPEDFEDVDNDIWIVSNDLIGRSIFPISRKVELDSFIENRKIKIAVVDDKSDTERAVS